MSGPPRAAAGGLAALERALLALPVEPRRPQLFILGLPRSGTTLVYQYLVHRLRLAYFTNAVGRFPRAPSVTTLAQRARHGGYVSDFESAFGKVAGAVAPREAGAFWARFFDLHAYSAAADLTPRAIRTMRRTVGLLERGFGGVPFANKNVKHMLRLEALSIAFPEAVFLVVERDLPSVGLSVLRARTQAGLDDAGWWSVRPHDFEELRSLPAPEQVARQLVSLSARLEDDLARHPAGSVLRVDYAHFCREPEALAAALADRLGTPSRNGPAGPFTASRPDARTDEEQRLLRLLTEASSPV